MIALSHKRAGTTIRCGIMAIVVVVGRDRRRASSRLTNRFGRAAHLGQSSDS